MSGQPVALVSGGSSGLGAAIAAELASAGYCVYELSRSGSDCGNINHLPGDMRDAASLEQALEQLLAEQGQLDLLINNAGFGISGAAEDTEAAAVRAQFEVNFFGLVELTRLATPALRESKGCIINISSVAAVLPIPFQAFYSAVKAAINAYTLALTNELRPFGIRVAAILPGDTKTDFTAQREKAADSPLYGERVRAAVARMEKDEQNGMPPQTVARLVVRISKRRHPRPLYTCGAQYHFFLLLGKILPARLSNWIVYKMYG